ncbi:MAG TPA: hypothetical protein PLV68_13030, partial [Ilumatobacteraceae bacterium]|nr:hypothetical protein [Ilumatobacteraceae bacterium]
MDIVTVRAPRAGFVTRLDVREGQLVQRQAQLQAGRTPPRCGEQAQTARGHHHQPDPAAVEHRVAALGAHGDRHEHDAEHQCDAELDRDQAQERLAAQAQHAGQHGHREHRRHHADQHPPVVAHLVHPSHRERDLAAARRGEGAVG